VRGRGVGESERGGGEGEVGKRERWERGRGGKEREANNNVEENVEEK